MPLAHAVAIELRKLADSLDTQPDLEIKQGIVHFWCGSKEEFLSTASLLPRPFKKSEDTYGTEDYRRIHLSTATEALNVDVSVYKSLTCELVKAATPAVYRCVPILSEIEEAAIQE